MPRRRMIDPDFWNDSRIKRLPPVERLFFIGMISHADDEGRLLADPAFLRSKVFPYDDYSLEDIESMRDHILATNPNVHLYENSGEAYIFFSQWSRYQKPSHPRQNSFIVLLGLALGGKCQRRSGDGTSKGTGDSK